MADLPTRAELEKLKVNADRLDGIVNGPDTGETSVVEVDSGEVKTVARVVKEIETTFQDIIQSGLDDLDETYSSTLSEHGVRLTAIESEISTPLIISSLVATGTGITLGVAEVGATVTPTLTWIMSKDPTTQSIDQSVGTITPNSARTASGGSRTTTTTFTLTASNAALKTVTRSVTLNFLRKRYWGGTSKADGTALTRTEILAAETAGRWEWVTGLSMAQKSFALSNEYGWIAEPASIGTSPSFIFDGVAVVDAPAPDTFASFENTSGGVADYHVYRTGVKYTGTYGIAKP